MSTGKPRFLLLQVITPHYHRDEALKNMVELTSLVDTYGGDVAGKAVQHRVHPHPDTYIGPGKMDWLKTTIAVDHIDGVILNGIVKPSQLFRIEKALWPVKPDITVWDKVDLILNIFDAHARSRTAKLQIELARLEHLGPRIYGLGGTVLSRQGGGIGQRGGSGETNIEIERRRLKDRQRQIRQELNRLDHQTEARLRYRQEQGFGPVALVGYTSAGKTTLFNRLTGKAKLTHAGLFTTLDTVVGKLKTPASHLPILVSDTIGFIHDLPPSLIDAFRSTLMESMAAKVLLHVIDAADPDRNQKSETVTAILRELHLSQPVIPVMNKIDRLSDTQLAELKARYPEPEYLYLSAVTGSGVPLLKATIARRLIPTSPELLAGEYTC